MFQPSHLVRIVWVGMMNQLLTGRPVHQIIP